MAKTGFNRAILLGNLGRAPELSYVGEKNTAVCNFPLAVANRKGDAEWFQVVCWGKTAELANQYLDKGSQVLVDGRLQSENFEAQDGQKRNTVKLVASDLQFLARPQGNSGGGGGGQSRQGQDTRRRQAEPEDDYDDSDLPF